ncbi:FecR family protein [Phocaeicola sp.]
MNEDTRIEEKISRTLQAMAHPEDFSEEELRTLLADKECLQACRDLLDSKEALARRYAPAPDVEGEWKKFSARHTHRSGKRIVGFTAALLVAATIALFFVLRTSAPSAYTVFEATTVAQEITVQTQQGIHILNVPRGMNKKLELPDGTQVWLNAESQLEYPETFEGQERRAVRLKGEAYFEVAKDATHPFIVETDLLETQVLGTAFNVRAYSPEDAHVTLVEGSVKVSDARHKKEILMKPGQNATLQQTGNFTINEVEAKAYNSWAEGQFYFDNTELVEIMRELGRWYNINIIFTSKEAMHYRLHFQSDRSEPLSQVLDLLNSMQKVNATLKNDKVIVSL